MDVSRRSILGAFAAVKPAGSALLHLGDRLGQRRTATLTRVAATQTRVAATLTRAAVSR